MTRFRLEEERADEKIAVLLLAVLMAILCVGCDSQSQSSEAGVVESSSVPIEAYRIGIVLPGDSRGANADLAYYMEKYCRELENQGIIKFQILRANTALEMKTRFDDLRTWKVQAVLAFPQWTGLESTIQEMIDSGIPVLDYEVALDVDGVYQIVTGAEQIGSSGADYIVQKIGTEGRVIVLNSPTEGAFSQLVEKGFAESMVKNAPDIQIETYSSAFDRTDGKQVFEEILATRAQIDGVFTMDDEVALGVLDAIQEAGRTDIRVITGAGGSQEYLKAMSQNQSIWLESAVCVPTAAKDAIDNVVALAAGEMVERVHEVAPAAVDRETCAQYLDEGAPY